MITNRLETLYQKMEKMNLPVLALNPGSTLAYLTGLHFHLMERPTVLLLHPPHQPGLILPELETAKAETSLVPLELFPYSDNPADWAAAFEKACLTLDIRNQNIGVETLRLRHLEMQFIQNAAPDCHFMDASDMISSLRMIKDEDEIQNMRTAGQIAQNALQNTLKSFQTGISEKELASELIIQLLREGSEPDFPFYPIVSSGPNSADPHASPSNRKIREGELLLFDWGASFNGYASDITRTFAVGKIDSELEKIYSIVATANLVGRKIGKPGLAAGMVDQAARAEIEKAGYGAQFFHRTGHGLGMEAHEPPYIFGENSLKLQPGMVYTIEPGIYLKGLGGVRIEDDVVVTETGSASLTDMTRERITLG